MEVEGPIDHLDRFVHELSARPPALARIENVTSFEQPARGERTFVIRDSAVDSLMCIAISPDAATCDDCVAELFDPANRRYLYPFINCTNCGPRLTIVTGAPYDRARTTMSSFPMCAACHNEYQNPSDRRFHAQPVACAACGPRLSARDLRGEPLDIHDPVAWFAQRLRSGAIGALKGLGGYHLACDARNESAVGELRRRKHRDEKPFAVMLADVQAARRWCEPSAEEIKLLTSPSRPIVMLRRRNPDDLLGVAPGNPYLGIMLPYTPLHHLLMRAMNGVPLVMTSGNRSDEPISYTEPQVFERLAGIADCFLTHNRPIHTRCDDSVIRVTGSIERPIRRSRGYAPQPLPLPFECPVPILAVGGQLKATFALGQRRRAILSHHMGDLDHFEAYRSFESDVARYADLFAIIPRAIVHDLHPNYASTRYAMARAAREGLRAIAVQHHHAHMASCMAEHGLDEPVIGVSFDGTGFGTDGNIWGGEFLVGDFAGFTRAAHFRYVPMPGGDAAIREPWRMAVSHLADAGAECSSLFRRIDPPGLRTIRQVIHRRINSPLTSSVGRLFDAVAAIAGVRDRVSFEGQAAMELEWVAKEGSEEIYPYHIERLAPPLKIDTRPLICRVAKDADGGLPPATISRRFHSTLASIAARVCRAIREESGLEKVVLSGGVFMNARLCALISGKLEALGFSTFQHRIVPPNDGGLSLGQLAIAARMLSATRSPGEDSCVSASPAR